jgi:hypothetical protein
MRTPLLVGAALGLLGRSFPQASAQGLSQQGKKESVRALLKSLETRDPKSSRIINPTTLFSTILESRTASKDSGDGPLACLPTPE